MAFIRGVSFLLTLTFATIQTASADADVFRIHRDRILGTSFDLTIVSSREEKVLAESAALNEIERLDAIFSTYRPDSEVSALNASAESAVSDELIEVLTACETYREQSENAFSCRIGRIIETWKAAEDSGVVPESSDLRLLAGEIRRAGLVIKEGDNSVSRPEAVQLNFNALAKGYIIDAALAAAREAAPGASGILINIGGDLAAWGESPTGDAWRIGLDSSDTTLVVREGAFATSGIGARDITVGDQTFSHILSAADGWPVDDVQAVSVFAASAFEADALATLLNILPLNDSLEWIESLDGAEARITASDGRAYVSSGWAQLEEVSAANASDDASGIELTVRFEIPEKPVSDYERPYVAAWISDDARNLVRILLLAGDEPRWMEENYYWQRRFGRKAGSLVDAESGPTRRPGEYDLSWDGRDHDGNITPAGDYVFHIEASREHGSHQHDSIEFNLGDSGEFSAGIEPGEELGAVHIHISQD